MNHRSFYLQTADKSQWFVHYWQDANGGKHCHLTERKDYAARFFSTATAHEMLARLSDDCGISCTIEEVLDDGNGCR